MNHLIFNTEFETKEVKKIKKYFYDNFLHELK